MIKICPRCRRTFSGGTRCLNCREEVALLDLAEPAVRRAYLRGDGDLRATIRTYYGARSAMLLQFVGILFGLAFAVALARKSFALVGGARWGMAALAAVAAVAAYAVFRMLRKRANVSHEGEHVAGGRKRVTPEPLSQP